MLTQETPKNTVMGKTFLINVNCEKIFMNSGATNYTMLIDSSRMTIVYELVEWIRWMFSLQYCIYLMHEKSVIHELEDIQLLSELRNFEIMPCREFDCAHKKVYRTLLDNMNLIVPWNNEKVHKYFLDKINQMKQNFTQESTKANKCLNVDKNEVYFNEDQHLKDHPVKKKYITNICDQSGRSGESLSVATSCFEQNMTEKKNTLIQLEDPPSLSNPFRASRNKSLETKKATNESPDKISPNTNPTKKKFTVEPKSIENQTKAKKIKPFSVGEFLSVMRMNYEEKDMQESTSQCSTLIADERNSESVITAIDSSCPAKDEVIEVIKRQRTRKRKRSKKASPENQVFTSFELENKKSVSPLSFAKSNCKPKAHHIRFDMEDEEYVGDPSANELEVNNDNINIINSPFSENECKGSVIVSSDVDQRASQKSVHCVMEKKDDSNVGCLFVQDNEITGEENLICANDDKVNQMFSSLESIQLNNTNHNLNDLLSLREINKKGIVVQRY